MSNLSGKQIKKKHSMAKSFYLTKNSINYKQLSK